jgi:hypothetical protein
VDRPRITEVWRSGVPRAEVIAGPASVACDDLSESSDERLEFTIRLGEQAGHCFIMHSEANHLSQLSRRWVQHALQNLVLREGVERVSARLSSPEGLHLRLDDAPDREV